MRRTLRLPKTKPKIDVGEVKRQVEEYERRCGEKDVSGIYVSHKHLVSILAAFEQLEEERRDAHYEAMGYDV